MNVSAVIVTRGDVDLAPVLDSLPRDWEKVVYDNSVRDDVAVYGRYAAIADCEHDLIYVQDDDCVLAAESIEALVEQWQVPSFGGANYLVANMPERFRHDFYTDHCLVGFGALFHRDLPARAFQRFGYRERLSPDASEVWGQIETADGRVVFPDEGLFRRTCDVVFTGLTPRILVDLPYTNREFASAPNRMWRQPQHTGERNQILELVRQVRDA